MVGAVTRFGLAAIPMVLAGCDYLVPQPILNPTPPIPEDQINLIGYAPLTAANMVVKCPFVPNPDDPGDAAGPESMWIVQTDPNDITGYRGPDRTGADRLNWYSWVPTDYGEIFNFSTGANLQNENASMSEFLRIQFDGRAEWTVKAEYVRWSGEPRDPETFLFERSEESRYVGHCLFGPAHR